MALKMRWVILAISFLLSACQGLPQDSEGTLARIEKSHTFAVGIVAGTQDHPEMRRLLGVIQQRTNARAHISQGPAETLLTSLSDGKIDLVIGSFAKDSPWETDVAFGPPLTTEHSKKNPIELRAVMRNGENRWIMLVENASRGVSIEASAQ